MTDRSPSIPELTSPATLYAQARIVVGLPVHNGERYLDEAIQAILGQDYANFEILICDNGSTDRTSEICEKYAGERHVRSIQFEENVGGAQSFNRVFDLAEGDLFCLAASDDRMFPGFLSTSVDALVVNPGAAMSVTPVRFIDAEGCPMGSWPVDRRLASTSLAVRLRSYLHRPGWQMIYNVVRRSVLSETALVPQSTGGDVILVWSILLHHTVCVVEEPLIEYRVTPRTAEGQAAAVAPSLASTLYRFGHCRMWREMWRQTGRSDLSSQARATARRALCRWLVSRYWRALLFRDLYAELRYSSARRRPMRSVLSVVAMFVLRPAHAVATASRGLREISQLRRNCE